MYLHDQSIKCNEIDLIILQTLFLYSKYILTLIFGKKKKKKLINLPNATASWDSVKELHVRVYRSVYEVWVVNRLPTMTTLIF